MSISLGARITQAPIASSSEGDVCCPAAGTGHPREQGSAVISCGPRSARAVLSVTPSLSFQRAFPDFTSFHSVFLSALLALSTASPTRKPPRSARARRTTPGPHRTLRLPPARVRLAEVKGSL